MVKHEKKQCCSKCKDIRRSAKAILWDLDEIREDLKTRQWLDTLPPAEPWLDQNPEAKAMLERGLKQAAVGKTEYVGSFAQYADLDIDD
jgi:hypothetical protein